MNIKSIIKSNQLLNPYFTAIILAILTICLLPTATHAAANTVNILIKGEPVQFTDQTGRPFIDSNARTLVPMRIVMEKYGCTVDWEQESLSAIVKKGDVTVKVPTMQKFIMVNNVRQDTDTQPQNINGRIYLPVAAVLRAVGADVQWDDESRSVVVDGVGQSNVANPTGTQSINSNKGNVSNSGVGMVKPEGYDEFMKDFEVVRVTNDAEINLKGMIVRNTKLDSLNLQKLFLAISEEKLKKYIAYMVFSNIKLVKNEACDVIFYSNSMNPNSSEIWITFSESRILMARVTLIGDSLLTNWMHFNDYEKPINK